MTEKPSRYFLDKANPKIWRSLNGVAAQVNKAAEEAGIGRALLELMYVRISQINGCAYCLDLHSRLAVEAGIPQELLAFIPAWQETGAFSESERAALAIGEVVTELPPINERRAILSWARGVLGDTDFGVMEWAAVTMNAYNRVSILSEHPARNPRP